MCAKAMCNFQISSRPRTAVIDGRCVCVACLMMDDGWMEVHHLPGVNQGGYHTVPVSQEGLHARPVPSAQATAKAKPANCQQKCGADVARQQAAITAPHVEGGQVGGNDSHQIPARALPHVASHTLRDERHHLGCTRVLSRTRRRRRGLESVPIHRGTRRCPSDASESDSSYCTPGRRCVPPAAPPVKSASPSRPSRLDMEILANQESSAR